MKESETQRAVTAHRDAADRPIISALLDAVFVLDEGDEFLQEEIAVAHGTVGRIDIERLSTLGSDDEKFSNFALLPEIVEQSPSARVKKSSLVVAEAVQKIKHRVGLGWMLRSAGFIAGGQVNAVMNRMFQNSAVQRVAVDSALSVYKKREEECREQQSDSKMARHSLQFTRSARPGRDRGERRVPQGKGRLRD